MTELKKASISIVDEDDYSNFLTIVSLNAIHFEEVTKPRQHEVIFVEDQLSALMFAFDTQQWKPIEHLRTKFQKAGENIFGWEKE